MSAHLFNESGQMQEVEIPDIFDVLEGGEDENAVKFLLGFSGEEENNTIVTSTDNQTSSSSVIVQSIPSAMTISPVATATTTASTVSATNLNNNVLVSISPQKTEIGEVEMSGVRKRDTSGLRAIYSCDSCGKSFTTKFNLKRHINMHCHKSKEAGVPIQGPPSASAPSRKKTSSSHTNPLPPQSMRGQPKQPLNSKQPTIETIVHSLVSASSTTAATTTPSSPATILPVTPLPESTLGTVKVAAPSIQLPQQPIPLTLVNSNKLTNSLDNTQLVNVIANTNHLLRNTSIPAIVSSITISGGGVTGLNNNNGSTTLLQSPITTSTEETTVVATIPSSSHIDDPSSEFNVLPSELFEGSDENNSTMSSAPPSPSSSLESIPFATKTEEDEDYEGEEQEEEDTETGERDEDDELNNNYDGRERDLFHESELYETIWRQATGTAMTSISEFKPLTSIPPGWIRKVVDVTPELLRSSRNLGPGLMRRTFKVYYYNGAGQKFAGYDDLEKYFFRMGYSIAHPEIFNFEDFEITNETDGKNSMKPLAKSY